MSRLPRSRWPLVAFFLVATVGRGPSASAQTDVLARFEGRVAEYAELRQRLSADLPSLSPVSTPEQIMELETKLAQRLRSARAGAQHGDIFDAAVRQRLRELLLAEFDSPRGPSTRAAIMDVNPNETPLRVNAFYPEVKPHSTVPPNLLRLLPPLPPHLEYRFVGPHMVLRDARANLILDFVLNVVPPA